MKPFDSVYIDTYLFKIWIESDLYLLRFFNFCCYYNLYFKQQKLKNLNNYKSDSIQI